MGIVRDCVEPTSVVVPGCRTDQLLVTPGIILGRFMIHDRVKVAIGGGYQVALTPHVRTSGEIRPTYDHDRALSARLIF